MTDAHAQSTRQALRYRPGLTVKPAVGPASPPSVRKYTVVTSLMTARGTGYLYRPVNSPSLATLVMTDPEDLHNWSDCGDFWLYYEDILRTSDFGVRMPTDDLSDRMERSILGYSASY